MGLKSDIKAAFETNLSSIGQDTVELSPLQKKNIDKLSESLRDAVVDFLLQQIWTITELKASVELEEFKTRDSLDVNVKPKTLLGPHAPAIDALKMLGVDIEKPIEKAAEKVSQAGASVNIDITNNDILDTVGHAYIGPDARKIRNSDKIEEENDFTKVKLIYEKIPKGSL